MYLSENAVLVLKPIFVFPCDLPPIERASLAHCVLVATPASNGTTKSLIPSFLDTKLAPTHRTRRVGLQALHQTLLPEAVAARRPHGIVVRLVLAERHLVHGSLARRLVTLLLAEVGQTDGLSTSSIVPNGYQQWGQLMSGTVVEMSTSSSVST